MTKKQTYIALGTAFVVVLGVIAYLGMGSNEPDLEAGPPVLEENPSLSGTLTAQGGRNFRVDDDGVADLLNYGSKSPSNFLIFTTPENVSATVDELAENLIVDDGLSGYVMGSYRPDEGGWNLYPEKNYLGALAMNANDQVRGCETYFVIKIADDHNTENGFGAANGWGAEQRSQIAFDSNYFDTMNSGTNSCSMEDKNLVPNAWNMVTTDVSAADALLGEFDLFEKVYAVWDTTVINQIDRSTNPARTTNANVKVYVDSENTGLENNLLDYFSGEIQSASLFDADASYDGGKQDLWVFVGELGVVAPPVNNPPELSSENRVVNISSEIDEAKKASVADASLSPLSVLLMSDLRVPVEEMFRVTDGENDPLALVNLNSNDFNYSFDGSSVNISDTTKTYANLRLDSSAQRQYQVDVEVSDGNQSVSGVANVTYEWPNSCVAISDQYEDHLVKSLEHRIYEEYKTNGEDFELALRTVMQEVEDTIANTSFGSIDPSLNEDQIRGEVMKYWSSIDDKVAAVRFSSDYLENPPYLPAQCGSGFGTCVDVVACTFMVDSVSNYMYGFGILVEKIAFPKQSESQRIEQSVMTVDPRELELTESRTVESRLMTP